MLHESSIQESYSGSETERKWMNVGFKISIEKNNVLASNLTAHFGALLVLLYESTPILLCSQISEHYIESCGCETLVSQLYEVSPPVSTLSDESSLPLEVQSRQSSGNFSGAALLNLVDSDNQTALHLTLNTLDVKRDSHHIERFALELLKSATREDISRVLPDGRSLLYISFNRGYDATSRSLLIWA